MAKNLNQSFFERRVIWITGLSGAGKSTLAREVSKILHASQFPVVILDGDELREVFGVMSVNTDNDNCVSRLALAMQYAHLCRVIAAQEMNVVIAIAISLFREVRTWNRAHLPGYFEVFLRVPMNVLRERDPKGIYRRFDEGHLKDIAGLDISVAGPWGEVDSASDLAAYADVSFDDIAN